MPINLSADRSHWSISRPTVVERKQAQLSQRDRATLHVIEYFPKSPKVIRNNTVE